MSAVSIANMTKGKLPRLPFDSLKKKVLGGSYELSLAFIADADARRLNKKLRKKDTVANVLSLPISKNSGEILIAPAQAKREAPTYGQTYQKHLAHLFIHGLLHLKGFPHGARMDSEEKKLLARV